MVAAVGLEMEQVENCNSGDRILKPETVKFKRPDG